MIPLEIAKIFIILPIETIDSRLDTVKHFAKAPISPWNILAGEAIRPVTSSVPQTMVFELGSDVLVHVRRRPSFRMNLNDKPLPSSARAGKNLIMKRIPRIITREELPELHARSTLRRDVAMRDRLARSEPISVFISLQEVDDLSRIGYLSVQHFLIPFHDGLVFAFFATARGRTKLWMTTIPVTAILKRPRTL